VPRRRRVRAGGLAPGGSRQIHLSGFAPGFCAARTGPAAKPRAAPVFAFRKSCSPRGGFAAPLRLNQGSPASAVATVRREIEPSGRPRPAAPLRPARIQARPASRNGRRAAAWLPRRC